MHPPSPIDALVLTCLLALPTGCGDWRGQVILIADAGNGRIVQMDNFSGAGWAAFAISMLRWPGEVKPGQVLNGVQAHMDMFTSFAAAAGVPDVVEQMKRDKEQYIDGVDNLDYWKGKSAVSRRDDFLYYYESRLTAVRMGPWKMHFSTREDYYDTLQGRTAPLLFNLRSDPFETYDNKDSFGHLGQRVSWVFQPIVEHVLEHLKTLAEYPPVQGGTSFDMSNIVQDFLRRSKQ